MKLMQQVPAREPLQDAERKRGAANAATGETERCLARAWQVAHRPGVQREPLGFDSVVLRRMTFDLRKKPLAHIVLSVVRRIPCRVAVDEPKLELEHLSGLEPLLKIPREQLTGIDWHRFCHRLFPAPKR
jgi:hypothetical protein